MKAIIDGKRYNTDTAKPVFDCGSPAGMSYGDFGWWGGTVYRTKGGAYFLAGEGNAASRFAERVGDAYGSGEGIQPLTEREAFALAQEHADADTVERHFGHLVEDARGPGRPEIGPVINVRIPPAMLDAIDGVKAVNGEHSDEWAEMPRAEVIRRLLLRALYDDEAGVDPARLWRDRHQRAD